MLNATDLLAYLLVFLIGFISGKLFTAVQFSFMKSAAKAGKEDLQARRSVDRLLRLGKRL